MNIYSNMGIAHIMQMAHSPIHNYVVPGLTSWLIGKPSASGCVRLFECSREQQEFVTPHSHRYDFSAMVLRGEVTNTLWSIANSSTLDRYNLSNLYYEDKPGVYVKTTSSAVAEPQRWAPTSTRFGPSLENGPLYGMAHGEIHSIKFGRKALVIVFEGPTITTQTKILEPCDGEGNAVETFSVAPWMFRSDEPSKGA